MLIRWVPLAMFSQKHVDCTAHPLTGKKINPPKDDTLGLCISRTLPSALPSCHHPKKRNRIQPTAFFQLEVIVKIS